MRASDRLTTADLRAAAEASETHVEMARRLGVCLSTLRQWQAAGVAPQPAQPRRRAEAAECARLAQLGATVEEVARAMGRSAIWVRDRLRDTRTLTRGCRRTEAERQAARREVDRLYQARMEADDAADA